jgi:hypothetical protein
MADPPQALMEEAQALRDQIAALTVQVQELQSRTPQVREPNIKDPDVFTGNRTDLENFILQLRLAILGKPSQFRDDTSKVLYAASYMRDSAQNWVKPLLHTNPLPEVITNFEKFINALQTVFGDPDEAMAAQRKMSSLKQTNSAAAYASEFMRLRGLVPWNDEACKYAFYQGLRESVKDELAKLDHPSSLPEYITLAIKIDNRLHDRAVEKRSAVSSMLTQVHGHKPSPAHSLVLRAPAPRSSSIPVQVPRGPAISRTAPYPVSMPMEIDGGRRFAPLSDEEKRRRRQSGLCLYCARPGHIATHCPFKHQGGPSRIASVTTPSNHTMQSISRPTPQVNSSAQKK